MLTNRKVLYLIFPAIIVQLFHSIFAMITYDEVNFLSIATRNSGLFGDFSVENFEGFGMIFWFLYMIIIRTTIFITQDHEKFVFINQGFEHTRFLDYTDFLDTPHLTLIFMRSFAAGALLLFLAKFMLYIGNLHKETESKGIKLWNFGILLAFSISPLFAWSGKLASPEYFATFFCGIAAIFTLEKKPLKALVWMSIAFSFKISATPVIVGLLFVILVESVRQNSRKFCLRDSVVLAFNQLKRPFAIVLILNPILIYDTRSFLGNLPIRNSALGQFSGINWENEIKTTLFTNFQTWDLVSINGFLYWGGWFLVPLALVSWLIQKRFCIRLTFLAISSFILLIGGVSFYPWYQFPLVCTLFVFATLDPKLIKQSQALLAKTKATVGSALVMTLALGSTSNGYKEFQISWNWNKDRISTQTSACDLTTPEDSQLLDLALISKSVRSETTSFYTNNSNLDEFYRNDKEHITLILGAVSTEKYLELSEQNGYGIIEKNQLCGSINIYKLQLENEN